MNKESIFSILHCLNLEDLNFCMVTLDIYIFQNISFVAILKKLIEFNFLEYHWY